MTETQPIFLGAKPLPRTAASVNTGLDVADLKQCAVEFLVHCEYLQQSPRTLEHRQMFIKNLLWFLEHQKCEVCGTHQLKLFFNYLRHGHEEAGGRWGKPNSTKPLRSTSVKDYYIGLQGFFKWLVAEEIIEASPLAKVERPRVREEVKQPLSPEQTQALLRASRISTNRYRDETILLMLFDSGVRASELIALRVNDINLSNGNFQVAG